MLLRKRIGQETRKEKQHNREVKKVHQLKENQGEAFKDSFMILFSVVAVFGAVYLIIYFAVRNKPSTLE